MKKTNINNDIELTLKYAKSLVGIPYSFWDEKKSPSNIQHPFYINKIPTKNYLMKNGINCIGFLNIILLKLGKNIEGFGKDKGRIGWYYYFEKNNLLKPFDYNKKYVLGTLLIRKYRNNKDKGHVAILYKYNKKEELKNKILHSDIIHAYKEGALPLL